MKNKRIKELYAKATGSKLSVDDFVLDDWELKFAELLITDCAKVASELNHVYSHQAKLTAETIMKHFELN